MQARAGLNIPGCSWHPWFEGYQVADYYIFKSKLRMMEYSTAMKTKEHQLSARVMILSNVTRIDTHTHTQEKVTKVHVEEFRNQTQVHCLVH